MNTLAPLLVQRVAQINALDQGQPWLVRSLWARSAVGILGGPPKCGKTWLGLDLAISVASGTPCLDAFHVDTQGPALVYLAEDSLEAARQRIEGICQHRGLDLEQLDLYLITEPDLRLDREADLHKLAAAIVRLEPRLLLLDPFVRLHRRDENSSADVSALLGDLRLLQRKHNLAIMLVHHVRKNGRGPHGEALRGSSDLHAWGDCNAYLARRAGTLQLALEQRFYQPIEPLDIRLVSRPDGSCTHLEVANRKDIPGPHPVHVTHNAVLAQLATAGTLPRTTLRANLRLNNQRLGTALQELERLGQIRRTTQGWMLAESTSPAPFRSST